MMTTEKCSRCDQPLDGDTMFRRTGESAHVACQVIPVFVYGTLRMPTPWAWKHLAHEPAQLRGARMWNRGGAYPIVTLDGDRDEIVHGEVVFVDRDDTDAMCDVEQVRRTEIGAGYVEVRRPITLVDGTIVDATVYVFEDSPPDGGCARIESGDWRAFEASFRRAPQNVRGGVTIACDICDFDNDETAVTCTRCGEPMDAIEDDDWEDEPFEVVWYETGPATWVAELDGENVWEGHSLAALERWAKSLDATLRYGGSRR